MRLLGAPSRTRLARGLAVGAIAALTVACGAGASAPPDPVAKEVPPNTTLVEQATLRPGDVIPSPTGDEVLSVTGRIAATNVGDSLRLDPAILERLGLVRVSVYEPWVQQNLDFQGVWLADLLALADSEADARSIHLTALDDYQIDLSMADVMAGGIFLATRTGAGAPIPIEDGGPTRIVFVGGVPSGSSADQWIWSLSTIDVR